MLLKSILTLNHAQSINVIESPEFRNILLLCCESLRDKDIPHHTKIRDAIINTWKEQFLILSKDMQVCCFHACPLLTSLTARTRKHWVGYHIPPTSGWTRGG